MGVLVGGREKLRDITWINTTPLWGVGADSRLTPDETYVKGELHRLQPDIVLACGQQAEAMLTPLWAGHLICIPHPACRVVTNRLLKAAGEHLRAFQPIGNGMIRVAYRQLRGRYRVVRLEEQWPVSS